jgi:hypothetical protein
MANGHGGKREGAGRKPGGRNWYKTNQLLEAKRAVAEAHAQGRKLAKEVADDFMHIYANMALEVRPVTERELRRGVPQNPKADERAFKQLSEILLSWVEVLIPYQSARFQTVRIDVPQQYDASEETGAMATLERLLDAYAAANEEERRLREKTLTIEGKVLN